jgi:hypothetical protein
MNITGSFLSSWWHNRLPPDDVPKKDIDKAETLVVQ